MGRSFAPLGWLLAWDEGGGASAVRAGYGISPSPILGRTPMEPLLFLRIVEEVRAFSSSSPPSRFVTGIFVGFIMIDVAAVVVIGVVEAVEDGCRINEMFCCSTSFSFSCKAFTVDSN